LLRALQADIRLCDCFFSCSKLGTCPTIFGEVFAYLERNIVSFEPLSYFYVQIFNNNNSI
jgi:hypothetical protein